MAYEPGSKSRSEFEILHEARQTLRALGLQFRVAASLYRTEQSAWDGAVKCGGVVLEVPAQCLRGQLEFSELTLVTEEDETEYQTKTSCDGTLLHPSPRDMAVDHVLGQDVPYERDADGPCAFTDADAKEWLLLLEKALRVRWSL